MKSITERLAHTQPKRLENATQSAPLARVRVYGHPQHLPYRMFYPNRVLPPDWGEDHVHDGELESEFFSHGGMHLSGGFKGDVGLGWEQKPEGACFFGAMIDYAGLSEYFPRAKYPHLIIFHVFDWETRTGGYIHIPYGGRIEIEAV